MKTHLLKRKISGLQEEVGQKRIQNIAQVFVSLKYNGHF